MQFRPLRSRAFWFGVPGLLFLLWWWWFSIGCWSGVGFGATRPLGIVQSRGDLVPFWNSDGWPDGGIVYYSPHAMSAERGVEYKRELVMMQGVDPTFRYRIIPYYLLVLAYVAGWAGLLGWRLRIYRQAATGLEAACD